MTMVKRKKSKSPTIKKPAAAKNQKGLPVRSASKIAENRSWLLYGKSGTGKTTLAATFPSPILLLDVGDKGTDSIADVKDVDVMDINTWDDIEDAYWWLESNPSKYKTVIIDTATGLQGVCIEKGLADKNKKAGNAGDFGTMTIREWGEVASRMKEWTLNFRDLDCNMVFLAQDRVFNVSEDEGSTDEVLMPEVGARLSPSICSHMNSIVSVIGNTYIRREVLVTEVKMKSGKVKKKEEEVFEYCLRIGPNPIYITKLRKPRAKVPPAIIVDPSFKDLIKIIKGE